MDTPSPSAGSPLDAYRGSSNVLLLFAPSVKDPSLQQQLNLFSGGKEDFARRRLVLARVLLEGQSSIGDRSLGKAEAAALRDWFEVDPGRFCLVLVAEEGAERRRDTVPLKPSAIFDVLAARVRGGAPGDTAEVPGRGQDPRE